MAKKSKKTTLSDDDRIAKANWSLFAFFVIMLLGNITYSSLRLKYPAFQKIDSLTDKLKSMLGVAIRSIRISSFLLAIPILILAVFTGLSIGLKFGYDKEGKKSFQTGYLLFNVFLLLATFTSVCILLIFKNVDIISTILISSLFVILTAMVLNIIGKRMKAINNNIGSYALYVLSLFFISISFLLIPVESNSASIASNICFGIAFLFILLSIMFYGKSNVLDLWYLFPYMFLSTFYIVLIFPSFIGSLANNLSKHSITSIPSIPNSLEELQNPISNMDEQLNPLKMVEEIPKKLPFNFKKPNSSDINRSNDILNAIPNDIRKQFIDTFTNPNPNNIDAKNTFKSVTPTMNGGGTEELLPQWDALLQNW